MKVILKLAAVLCLSLLILFSDLAAQTTRPDFNRPSSFDVQHYVLRVAFDRDKKRVFGDTTVRLKPLKDNFSSVTLDSVGITYSAVTLQTSNVPLKFKTDAASISIDLDRSYKAGEEIAIRFVYTATPKKGIYFIDAQRADQDLPSRSAQIWTQGEPDEARHWFPGFDFPSDKATVEQYITAKAKDKVIGNGILVDKATNSDGTVTHHFRMDQPFSTYLVSFVIGDYSLIEEKYRDIPLGYYVYPGSENIVPKAFGRTKEMLKVFEEITGVNYPFPKYDQTIVSAFEFGGMENITATTMSDRDIFLINNPLFEGTVVDLVSHELAHSWFGNMVTCKNWAELWLNEGFATFMEAAFREKMFGRQNYILKIHADAEQYLASDAVNNKKHGLYNQNAGNVAALFDVPFTTYNKGGAVLHTLREEIGDEGFWKMLGIYLNRHKWSNVETSDLQAAAEEASGKKLDWFFDQWVYGTGSPKISIKPTYSARSKVLTLAVSQTQDASKLTPAAFRIPLEIEIETGAIKRTEKIEITKRSELFKIKVEAKPGRLIVDRNEKIPIKTVKMGSIGESK